MSDVTLLGPQRKRPSINSIARNLAGPIAVITAGWQENENYPLPSRLADKATNLGIYRRAEAVFDEDRELFQAHRERQLLLKQLQRLYRRRLDHAVAAYKELAALEAEGDLAPDTPISHEVSAALEAVRALDGHHLERVRAVHVAFEAEWQPAARPAVASQRRELEAQLEAVEHVVIAGGHVAVLLNRLRLFDLAPLLTGKALIACSAGAMVASRRIVLFHDSPPWGAGNAEVLDIGLDLCGDVLPLPDAERRLRGEDPQRVALLARRFAPLVCVGLDEKSRLCRDEEGWRGRAVRVFASTGAAEALGRTAWQGLEQ